MSLLLLLGGEGAVAPGDRLNRLRVFERAPMRTKVIITSPSGKSHRWGEDSPTGGQVIEDMSDSDSVPGGDKEFTASLARRPGEDYSDMIRGSRVEVRGAGNYLISEYRLDQAPIVSGDRLVISPAAIGYEAALSDDPTAQEIYLAADLGEWEEPSAGRRAAVSFKLNAGGQSQLLPAGTPNAENLSSYSAVPALAHSWTALHTTSELDVVESWYSGGGVQLGGIEVELLNVQGPGGGSWHNIVAASSDDLKTAAESLKDFVATTGTGNLSAAALGRYYLLLQSYYGAGVDEEGHWEQQWRNIKVYGRSGIPVYGTYPTRGVLASDVIADAISRWAPEIRFTTGPHGTIQPTSFPIPHLVFKEPTTVAEIIQQACRFELPEYGVWASEGGPTFHLCRRGAREGRKRWRVRAKAANLEDTGQRFDRVFNGVVVTGTGTDGRTISIGPSGSGMQLTSARLLDRDPTNAANEARIKRYAKLQMKGVCTYEGMLEAGEAFLEQTRLLDGSGKATLPPYVEDENGHEWPYYYVHSGDEVDFIGSSIRGWRYIVNVARSRASRTAAIDIDAPPDSFEALMERLGAELAGIGLAS